MLYAIYYELSDGSKTVQSLFVPAIEQGGRSVPPLLYHREVTEALPNRRWGFVSSTAYNRTRLAPTLELAVDQFAGLSHTMRGALSLPILTLNGTFPLVVTDSDIVDLLEDHHKLPSKLQARISQTREKKSFRKLPGRGA